MRIKKLTLNNFGPFKEYTLSFADDGEACVLLTGRNNEGKSNIILALKLLSYACKVIGRQKSRIVLEAGVYYQLLQQDVSGINIGRTLYNCRIKTKRTNPLPVANCSVDWWRLILCFPLGWK